MHRLRPWIFWTHLASGVLAGLLILFFSATGMLLAFERQIVAHADRAYQVHPGNAARVPVSAILANAPSGVTDITVHSAPDAPIELRVGRRDVYMANPYDGTIQGPASPHTRAFFATVTSLHRWFGLEDTHREAASAVKGVAVCMFVYLLLSGAMLWLPKRWTRSAIAGSVTPRLSGPPRAAMWNWHKVAGFWAGVPLLVITTTGVIMAYPWANALLFELAGSPVPVRHAPQAAAGGKHGKEHHGASPEAITNAFAAVEQREAAGWQSIDLRLPAAARNLAFTVDRSDGGHPETREQVTVQLGDGQDPRVRRESYAEQSRGQRWHAWVRFMHTGEAGGVAGETIAALAALGACVLVLTGLCLSIERLLRVRRNARRHIEARELAAR